MKGGVVKDKMVGGKSSQDGLGILVPVSRGISRAKDPGQAAQEYRDMLRPGDISYLNQVMTIGEDEIFVMGDNRNNSFDSRYFGTIPEDKIFGKFMIIYWPPSRW